MASNSPLAKYAAQFDLALQAAHQACGAQDYPAAALYVVATPIGNLADISLRALQVLQTADLLACEDTRHSQSMLRALGIDKPKAQWLAVHQHNEAQISASVVERLMAGQRVAYVSDAGTPAISDPGARLVSAVRAQGIRVVPIPGASSVTALLSAAGITHHHSHGDSFVFNGFLPSKPGERRAALEAMASEPRAQVILEAPHRIESLAQAMTPLGQREITVGREITKQFEQIVTLPAAEFAAWLAADSNRCRGEFALVLHASETTSTEGEHSRVLALLLQELPLKAAVRLGAEITGHPRNALYEEALALKKSQN